MLSTKAKALDKFGFSVGKAIPIVGTAAGLVEPFFRKITRKPINGNLYTNGLSGVKKMKSNSGYMKHSNSKKVTTGFDKHSLL